MDWSHACKSEDLQEDRPSGRTQGHRGRKAGREGRSCHRLQEASPSPGRPVTALCPFVLAPVTAVTGHTYTNTHALLKITAFRGVMGTGLASVGPRP